MTEGGISELFKWWVYLILIFGAIALFIFFYDVGQTNRFASFVAAEIERGGVEFVGDVVEAENEDGSDKYIEQKLGFTPETEARIREENDKYYGGRYDVDIKTSSSKDGVLHYGDIVDFELQGNYDTMFSWFRAPILSTSDQAIVQVRMAGSDGERAFAKSVFSHDDFKYSTEYDYVDEHGETITIRDVGVLTGFSQEGLEKYKELEKENLVNDFIAPNKNPDTNMTVTYIAEGAFKDYNFKGSFEAPNVKVIGDNAFRNSSGFNNQFKAPNLTRIGARSFEKADFTGDFELDHVELVGNDAFKNSSFNGVFEAPRVRKVGSYAFMNSKFTGSFNTPLATLVGEEAFKKADFQGYFNAPEIETIGSKAFDSSEFLNGYISGNEFIEED